MAVLGLACSGGLFQVWVPGWHGCMGCLMDKRAVVAGVARMP